MNFLVEVVTKIAQGSGFAALDIKTVIMLLHRLRSAVHGHRQGL